MRRRFGSTVAVGLVLLVGACSSEEGGAAGQLEQRLAGMEPRSRFAMAYQAMGTDVLDCAVPNRSFLLAVDLDADRMAAEGPGPESAVLAERQGSDLRLHRSLFAAGAAATEWLEVDLEAVDQETAATLQRVLGVDLASYLLASGLPESGEPIAAAALAVAASVELVADAETRPTFRLVLDAERFSEEAGGPPAGDAPPIIEVTVDDTSVVAVAVRPAAAEDADAAGWQIAFSDLGRPLPETAGTTTRLEALDLGNLAAAPISGCTIGDQAGTNP